MSSTSSSPVASKGMQHSTSSSIYKRSLSSGSAAAAVAGEPEKEQVVIDTADLKNEDLRHLQGALRVVGEELWHWRRFPIILPEPITQNNGRMTLGAQKKKTLRLDDLFIQPDFNEVKAIAVDANGEPIKLSGDQLGTLRQTGEFTVDSVQFPGQKHQWMVSQILVKGKEKAQKTFFSDLGLACYLTHCLAKSCLTGKHFSIAHGINGWSQGLMSLLDMIFGVPLMDGPDLYQKLHEERSKYLVAELICDSAEILARLKEYAARIGNETDWHDERPPQIPYQFQTPNGLPIDLRLFSADVISSAKPQLLWILNASLQGWFLTRRQEVLRTLQRKEKDPSSPELKRTAGEMLSKEYLDRVCDAVLADEQIRAIGAGIPELLVEQVRTSGMLRDIVEETREEIERVRLEAVANLKEQHQMLGTVTSWVNERADEVVSRHGRRIEWVPHEKAIQECKKQDLHQSAYFLSRDLAFRQERESLLLREFRNLKQPSRVFKFSALIWNPRRWVVKELRENGEYEVIPTVLASDDYHSSYSNLSYGSKYILLKKRVYSNSTRYPLWRWTNFFLRTFCWLWNALFLFGVIIPWCSSVSFRALLSSHSFFVGYVINSGNGRLVRDKSKKVETISSRLCSLWSHIRTSRENFEALPDTGLLSKNVSRHLNVFVNYMLKGGLGTLACLTVLPALFVLCSSFSVLLAVTSFLWVPLGSLFAHLFFFLFFDHDGVSALNAVVWNVLVNILCHGILMPIAAGIIALVLCPIGALSVGTFAVLRRVSRDAWDTVMFKLFLEKNARIPSQNNFLAKRISGPGLASEYFYQIKPEQALVALETRMELVELRAFENMTASRIREPLDNYLSLMRRLFSPFGLAPSRQVPGPCLDIEKETERLLTKLKDKAAQRRQTLESQISASVTSKVRLSDTDLRMVLANSAVMVKDFFPPRVFTLMSKKERSSFWEERRLMPDDWLGLACGLLTEFFSEGFLTPLQESDTYFSLQVNEWNLSQYMNMVMESTWKDDLDHSLGFYSQPSSREVRQPKILVESFNPAEGSFSSNTRPTTRFGRQLRMFSDRWHLHFGRKEEVPFIRLTNPLPLLHPVDIAFAILQRDSPNEAYLARELVKQRLSLLKNQQLLDSKSSLEASQERLLSDVQPRPLEESFVCEIEPDVHHRPKTEDDDAAETAAAV